MASLNYQKTFYKEVRILSCERLDEHFFADSFYQTKKAKKSSRCNECCQLCSDATQLILVVPSECEDEVIFVINKFAKETKAPYEIIMDDSRKEKSQKTKVL